MLEKVVGGVRRIVNTNTSANAAIRTHPGKNMHKWILCRMGGRSKWMRTAVFIMKMTAEHGIMSAGR